MKLSVAFLSLFAASASARSLSPKAAAKILRAARKLDENAQDEDEYAFLSKYNLKFVGCDASQQMVDQDNGDVTYGAAMLRLCPSDSGCDNKSVAGCKSGYGDFVVSIEDFVDAYFEDQADNMQWDDGFDGDKYAKCDEYEPEVDGDDNPRADYAFYVGPTCSDDGTDIKLGFFSEETCQTKSTIAFADVSNGWTLPYSTGGLISKNCLDCLEYNEDEAAYALRDMCTELYQEAPMKCESNMEYYSYNGKNEYSCDNIQSILPKAARVRSGSAGKIFGWILFVALIVGVAGYVMWWRKKKQASGASDGMLA